MGLPLAEPTIYAGHGGKWLDVEWLDVERVHESLRLILPIIVQRLTPREVAADWPPSLNQLSPNGLQTLSYVYLLATQEEAVKEVGRLLSALLRNPMPVKEWPQNPWLQTREWILPLPSGRRIVLATPSGPGLAESWLGENGPGIFAVGFSAPELKRSMAYLHDRGFSLHRQQPGEALEAEAAWLAPIGDIGVWLFIEQASPGAPRL